MLKPYLRAVQVWVGQGCPEGWPFWRSEGLCGNSYYFTSCPQASYELRRELRRAFAASGLNHSVPFNASYADFLREVYSKSVYSNPQRLEWIKNHAQDSN